MEFFIKLVLFVLISNWWISMHNVVNKTDNRQTRYIALLWAVAFSVACGFLIIP
jgi:hypothetical protein